ncbi:DUF6763 family protein [Simiduia agarivorans]|uniref:Uncharacterized protein n=1 Tax=Simiduia agarivorans (strain DSM 21679 / JCM 13881 / BCRC 17597 / SA1) TaxID=1117647 RepID=K4KEI6_SIMAS|nr:DUF6763 family protein [Simiduia agarivorans]AFU97464.1 hypothetical protein M5M_01165 [Simiduia agarivorans SA1 = DSM 21679]
MMKILARTGQWYLNVETGQHFEIVAIDEHTASIAIQYVDGDLDELDAENWQALALQYAAEPEDAMAGFGDTATLPNAPDNDSTTPFDPDSVIDLLEGDTFEGFDDA